MDNTNIENFRQTLIKSNPDVAASGEIEEISLAKQVEKTYQELDKLTDILQAVVETTDCPCCLRDLAVMLGESLSAYNSISSIHHHFNEEGDTND